MSVASTVSQASSIDWNVIAAAIAVFFGTLATTVLGWLRGRREVEKKLSKDDGTPSVTAAILQDNQTVREATLVSKEVRDQLLLHRVATEHLCRSTEESTGVERELVAELRLIREILDKRV